MNKNIGGDDSAAAAANAVDDEHEKQRLALSSKKRRDKLFALLKSDVVRMKSGKRVRLARADARTADPAAANSRQNLENSVPSVNTTGQLLGAPATAVAGEKRKSQSTVDDIQCSGQPLNKAKRAAAAAAAAATDSNKKKPVVVVNDDDGDSADSDSETSSSSEVGGGGGGAATHSAVITFDETQQPHDELVVLRSRTAQADTPTI